MVKVANLHQLCTKYYRYIYETYIYIVQCCVEPEHSVKLPDCFCHMEDFSSHMGSLRI